MHMGNFTMGVVTYTVLCLHSIYTDPEGRDITPPEPFKYKFLICLYISKSTELRFPTCDSLVGYVVYVMLVSY